MGYQLGEIAEMMRIYNRVEAEAKDFLFISSSALKNKEYQVKSAKSTLAAIEEYRKLPIELRNELEKNKSAYVKDIAQLENACNAAIARN